MKRRICIVTGSRADYGLLVPLIRKLEGDHRICVQLVVTGAHLSPVFGNTFNEIIADGFRIDEKVDISLDSDTPPAIATFMGMALKGCAEAYQRLKPDLVVVLGDRYEIFSAVSAAHVSRIPVAHLYGGELTKGTIDNAFRHSITKMSHLHLVAADVYRKRVIQLGEDPKRVFTVGALGLDNIRTMKLLSRRSLERELGFSFGKKNLLVTFHSATLDNDTAGPQFHQLLEAVSPLKDTRIIFTKTNADTYGRVINTMIDRYVAHHPSRRVAFSSLGQLRYLSALQYVDAVVGNSSSGIVEAPSFKIGTVNIGDRQEGRIRPASVIDCNPVRSDISRAIKQVYSDPFRKKLRKTVNPYGDGHASERIKKVLAECALEDLLKKRFYDLDFICPIEKR